MATYGVELININDGTMGPSINSAGGTIHLDQLVARMTFAPGVVGGGKILYFPPGVWRLGDEAVTVEAEQRRATEIAELRRLGEIWRSAQPGEERDAALIPYNNYVNRTFRANPWNGHVVLDPRVTLRFAVGATLVLQKGVRLVTQGDIDAPDVQIVDEQGTSEWIPYSPSQGSLKAVWWGAGAIPGRDDAERLERAIAAATIRRQPWWRNYLMLPAIEPVRARILPPVPLILAGQISLGRPVRCGGGDRALMRAFGHELAQEGVERLLATVTSAVLLVGVANGRSRPSAELIALDAYDDGEENSSGTAMLWVEFARASRVEGVAFDGRGRASRCLEFSSQSRLESDMHQILVQRCSFRRARRVLLQLGSPRELPERDEIITGVHDPNGIIRMNSTSDEERFQVIVPGSITPYPRSPSSRSQLTNPDVDFSGTTVMDCDFDARGAGKETQRTGLDAVVLRGQNSLPYTVVRCRFQGRANSFVSVVNGTSLVEACTFDNEQTLRRRVPLRPFQPTQPQRVGTEPAGGADIEMRWDILDRPFYDSSGNQVGRTTFGSVSVVGCMSYSSCLLATSRPSPFYQQTPNRSTLLMGYQQVQRPRRRSSEGGLSPVDPALTSSNSVLWGVVRKTEGSLLPLPYRVGVNPGQPLPHDAALCMVGCALVGTVDAYYGASTVSLVGVQASQRVRAVPVVEGIRRPILIMGYAALALLLLLGGCSPSPSPSDAAPTQDIISPSLDTTLEDASLSDEPSLLDANVEDRASSLDRPATADHYDAAVDAPPDRWVTVGDASLPIRTFESFGPARQMRHVCPGVLDGEDGIPAPRLIYPLSGLRATSRRPGFRWELAPGTIGARVEVCADPCCERVITAYDANGTSQPPAEMLPPGVVWWRARGRTAEGYGRATSFTWELGIRHRSAPIDTAWDHIRDINGDGYDDIVTTADVDYLTRVYSIAGGPGGPVHNPIEVRHPPQGGRLASPEFGDFNGDGHADVLLSVLQSVMDQQVHSLLRGSRTGLDFETPLIFESISRINVLFDVNGDGFDDLGAVLVNRTANGVPDLARRIVYGGPGHSFGGSSEVSDQTLGPREGEIRTSLHSVGDLDGDGYADVLVGDYRYPPRGRILVLRGGAGGPDVQSSRTMLDDSRTAENFGGTVVPLGDIDGDQLADFMVSLWPRRAVVVYRGNRVTMAEQVGVLYAPYYPSDAIGGLTFATPSSLGPGPDMNADGLAEIAIGCEYCYVEDGDLLGNGILYLYHWEAPGRVHLFWHGTNSGSFQQGSAFNGTAQGVGDVNGDGYDDLAIGTNYIVNVLRVFQGGSAGFDLNRRWELMGPRANFVLGGSSFGTYLAMFGLSTRHGG